MLHEPRRLRIPVEVVGFWTAEYLQAKLAALHSLPSQHRWLICIDESLAAAQDSALPPGPLFRFRRKIKVQDFLEFLEQWIESASAPSRARCR